MTWDAIKINGPLQDKYGWTDPETGEEYPPTYNWCYQIIALREDGQHYFVAVPVDDDIFATLDVTRHSPLMAFLFEAAMYQLNTHLHGRNQR